MFMRLSVIVIVTEKVIVPNNSIEFLRLFIYLPGNKTGVGLGSGFRHGLGQESRVVTLENGIS